MYEVNPTLLKTEPVIEMTQPAPEEPEKEHVPSEVSPRLPETIQVNDDLPDPGVAAEPETDHVMSGVDSKVTQVIQTSSASGVAVDATAAGSPSLIQDVMSTDNQTVNLKSILKLASSTNDVNVWKDQVINLMDEDQFCSLLEECRSHDRFESFCAYMHQEHDDLDDTWEFGSGQTDPLDDLLDMIEWLTKNDIIHQNENNQESLPAVEPSDLVPQKTKSESIDTTEVG